MALFTRGIVRSVLILLIGLALPAASRAIAAAPTLRIDAILDTVRAEAPDRQLTAEDQLVQEGDAALPALQEALATKRRQLAALQDPCHCLNAWDTPAAATLAAQITALDQAIFRLTYRVNPRQLIVSWAHALKFADGRAFTREFLPLPVLDVQTDRLQRIIPTARFYLVYLPGYQGGAAPPDEVLRAFEVPPPLQAVNLVMVDKDKTVRLAHPGTPGVRALLSRTLLRADRAQDAMYAWLRLTTALVFWNNQPLAFQLIEDKDITVTQRVARGVAHVAPRNENSGQLTVTLTFDVDGELATATETQDITFAPLLMPPCSAPPAGGPAGNLAP